MKNQRIIIWGTGKVAKETFQQCQTLNNYNIIGVVDNDITKQGILFENFIVSSPNIINDQSPDIIVVLTNLFDKIKEQINNEFPYYKGKIENKNFFYKESILKRYCDTNDFEIIQIINHIKNNGLDIFNYSFVQRYLNLDVQSSFDNNAGLFFVNHKGKRLYFSQLYNTVESVRDYYRSILMEQDDCSPHRYLCESFDVDNNDIVIDCGAAEGNFSLEIIDKVSRIYIIEADENWIEALKYTFKNYSDKVVIINKFISSYNEGNVRTLDSLINDKVNFIKMDIEGYEWDALNGAKRIINESDKLKLDICCYHSDFDQILIEAFMNEINIEHSVSDGYMWFPFLVRQNYVSTKLNHALIRGKKIN